MDQKPKTLRKYTNGPEEKFLTTQHERDQETGLDYRGARFYDSDVARFLSLDPHASNYPLLSDYSYVAGNPLMFVDPTGMAVEDHYTLDKKGYITKTKETDDDYDMLYTEDDYNSGDLSKGHRVNDQSLLKDLSEVSSGGTNRNITSSENKSELFNLFHYVAKNSNVEWQIAGYRSEIGNTYTLSTNHLYANVQSSANLSEYNVYNMIFAIHSHVGSHSWGEGASGFGEANEQGQRSYAYDMLNIYNLYKEFKSSGMTSIDKWFDYNGVKTIFPKHYIYQVKSGNFYNYTPWTPNIFIRNISSGNDLYRNLGF